MYSENKEVRSYLIKQILSSPSSAYAAAKSNAFNINIDDLRVAASKSSIYAFAFAEIIDKKYHPVTANGVLSSLNSSYEYAEKFGLTDTIRNKLLTSAPYAFDMAAVFDGHPSADTRLACKKLYNLQYFLNIDLVLRNDLDLDFEGSDFYIESFFGE